jgi:dihydrofolate reductase
MVMGDVTFFGIGKPLPNRKTIILSLDTSLTYDHKDVTICNDVN